MIDNCMNFLLSVSQHKVFEYYSKLLKTYNLTTAQVGILTCIWSKNNSKATPKEISEGLHLKAPTVSGLLDKLQKQDLIYREIDPNNRRVILVTTTEKANDLKNEIDDITEKMNQQVLKDFSQEEAELLRVFLSRLIISDFS